MRFAKVVALMSRVLVVRRWPLCGVVVLLLGVGLINSPPASAAVDFSEELVGVIGLTATDFSFSQSGFSDGALVTGTFSGTDVDANGQLSSFDGEISAFSMAFSGNTIVPAFTLGFADLFGLVYDLDGGPLGDGVAGDTEGIGADDGSFFYAAGPGPVEICGIGVDCAVVGTVPQPATWLLGAMGLAGLLGYRAWGQRTAGGRSAAR